MFYLDVFQSRIVEKKKKENRTNWTQQTLETVRHPSDKNVFPFTKYLGSLSCLQKPATGPCSEPY
jgi:hypothetical protein